MCTLERGLEQQDRRWSPPFHLAHCLHPLPHISHHASAQVPSEQQLASAPLPKALSAAAVVYCWTSAVVTSELPFAAIPQILPLAAVVGMCSQHQDGLQCLCCCLERTQDVVSARRKEAAQQSSQVTVIRLEDEAQHSQQV